MGPSIPTCLLNCSPAILYMRVLVLLIHPTNIIKCLLCACLEYDAACVSSEPRDKSAALRRKRGHLSGAAGICNKVKIETSLWLRRQWEDKQLTKEKFHQNETFIVKRSRETGVVAGSCEIKRDLFLYNEKMLVHICMLTERRFKKSK